MHGDAMTLDPRKLADAIDPRQGDAVRCQDQDGDATNQFAVDEDALIAASDALRALPSLQDEDDLARRLKSTNLVPQSEWLSIQECRELFAEAATTIQALRMRVATVRALAIEECARWHDDRADRIAAEHPGMQGSNSQRRRRNHHLKSAAAIRALQPTLEIDALVERAAIVLFVTKHGIPGAAEVMQIGDITEPYRAEYLKAARAVITEILGERG
jgi:hypothetical protein